MAIRATRRLLENQFVRFCAVGASGYAINLAVYAALLAMGLHYLAASAISFLAAASSNYVWNRTWTFSAIDAPVLHQGARAFLVSGLSLGVNQLVLVVLVAAGAGHLTGQAVAIVLATPFSFAANKLWAFAADPLVGELQTVMVQVHRGRLMTLRPEAESAPGRRSTEIRRGHQPTRTARAALSRARARLVA